MPTAPIASSHLEPSIAQHTVVPAAAAPNSCELCACWPPFLCFWGSKREEHALALFSLPLVCLSGFSLWLVSFSLFLWAHTWPSPCLLLAKEGAPSSGRPSWPRAHLAARRLPSTRRGRRGAALTSCGNHLPASKYPSPNREREQEARRLHSPGLSSAGLASSKQQNWHLAPASCSLRALDSSQ